MCLLNNGEFCTTTDPTYYTTGVCCSGMTSTTDLCLAANPWCTNLQTTPGAKFNKCPLSSACGSTTSFVIVKGVTKDVSVQISALGQCDYTIYYSLVDTKFDFNYVDWQ